MTDPAHGLVLLVVCPLVGAAVIPALCRGRPGPAWLLALLVVALTLLAGVELIARYLEVGRFAYAVGGWAAPYGIELRFDAFAALSVAFTLIFALSLIFARRTLTTKHPALFYSLMLINLGGLNGFMITGDLFNLFVFAEVFSVSAYALVAMSGRRLASLAALKYLLLGAVSSMLILLAVGVIFAQTGTVNMVDAGVRLAAAESGLPGALALALLTIGFLVKAALFPLHVWLPDAHASAPGPVSAVLSAVVVKAGVIGIIRIYEIFGESGAISLAPLQSLLIWLGAIGALFGALAALVQRDLKRMLAWSTVTNIGYIAIGLGIGSATALAGASAHILNHALIKSALFLTAAALIHGAGLRHIDDLRGLGEKMPLTAMALVVAMLALAGVPPTAGFVGKWQIALAALQAELPFLLVVIIAGGLLVLAYAVRVINVLFFQAPVHVSVLEAREASPSMLLPILVLAGLSLVMGLLGSPVLDFFAPAVAALVVG